MGLPERSVVWVAAIVAVVATIFWQTSWSMVTTWNSSDTYSHGFLILPAFLWLVWARRHQLAQLPIQPSWWALPILAMLGLLWLLGRLTSLALPTQFALVAMLPAAVAAILGVAWLRALLFPFVFLFFAVPFGDSFVPKLMDWTADFTVAALQLSGVPVYRDGLHFTIPSGNWSVVDSCSGIRYLFACLTVSTLYSWMIYRGTARRLLFIGCALVIALVANWVRAYAIVMLGHLSNNAIAAGADHLVYGGLFFGFIMALIFALGAVWREDASRLPKDAGPSQPAGVDPALQRAPDTWRWLAAALAALATVVALPAVSTGSPPGVHPSLAVGDIQPRAGWQRIGEPFAAWSPQLHNPAAVVTQAFGRGKHKVGVHLGVFHRPTPDSKLTSSLNRLSEPDGLNQRWKLARQGAAQVRWDGEAVGVRTGALVGTEGRLLAWQWYWVDGTATREPCAGRPVAGVGPLWRSQRGVGVGDRVHRGRRRSVRCAAGARRIRRRHVRIDRRGACFGRLDRLPGPQRRPACDSSRRRQPSCAGAGPPTIGAVSETPTQHARPCPQCSQTMAHLVLQGHQANDVVVDQCADLPAGVVR